MLLALQWTTLPAVRTRGQLLGLSGNSSGVKTPPNVLGFETLEPQAGTGRFGFDMEWQVTSLNAFDIGTYTITAP